MRDVSVIIPSYNRPEDLKSVLPFYYYQKDIKEIIIVDDGSTEPYSEVISIYKNYDISVEFKYIKNPANKGLATSRNIGLSYATGRYVLWGEDDAFPSPDYVQVLKQKIGEKKVIMGSIYYGIHVDTSLEERIREVKKQQDVKKELFDFKYLEGYYRIKIEKDTEIPWGHALFFIERKTYKQVSYYEGYHGNAFREETDIQVQLMKAGYSIIYTSDSCYYHFPPRKNKSGCHTANRLRYEISTIKNNDIFLDRQYEYIAFKYNISVSKMRAKIFFRLRVLLSIFKGAVRRLGRLLGIRSLLSF